VGTSFFIFQVKRTGGNDVSEEKIIRGFKGVWIPKDIIEKYGSKNAILISGFLQGAPGLSQRHRRIAKKLLNENKKNLSPKKIKDYILNNEGSFICDWCEKKTFVLHEHHYPIPKKFKGNKTVNICPNCHYTFHHMEN